MMFIKKNIVVNVVDDINSKNSLLKIDNIIINNKVMPVAFTNDKIFIFFKVFFSIDEKCLYFNVFIRNKKRK